MVVLSRIARIRWGLVLVAAMAAIGVPAHAAPGEQPGYRRLVELESTRTFSDELTAALTGPDISLAGRAALALGRTEDGRAAVPLRNATGARDVSLRALAVYGYGLLAAKVPVASDPIRHALGDPAGAVRVAAVDASGRARAAKIPGAAELAAVVATMMTKDRDPIVRARCATTLSMWRDAEDSESIGARVARAFMNEHHRTVRWHEAWTLRRAFPLAASPSVLRAGLGDGDELVRIAFVDMIARRKEARGVALLEPLLADSSWRVREQTRESITVLDGGTRTAHLTAVPAGVITPSPEPQNTEAPLARPAAAGAVRRPVAADARLDRALLPATSALMDGPMAGPHPRVRIGTTKGTIVVRLFPEWAPLTVANFIDLADRGYYDGLRWFRVVPDFVAQTGDPHDNGEGDAGYTIPAEENPLEQRSGVISMGLNYTEGANAGPIRDSAGTQFYLTISPQLHLDRDFTVFGEIESGASVLGRLIESDRMTRVERLPDD